ncbi:hypothetical protein ABZ769_11495 [Streptomyces olivoreticuli]
MPGPLAKPALFADAEGMHGTAEVWLSKELIKPAQGWTSPTSPVPGRTPGSLSPA